jgi:hypothetical protein
MKTASALALTIALSTGLCLSCPQTKGDQVNVIVEKKPTKVRAYDGTWWLAANDDERMGFLDGAGDCLESAARVTWLTHSVQSLEKKITRHYQAHPADRAILVTEVWRKLLSETKPSKPAPGSEVWTNPHEFLNGTWWVQSSETQQLGFLEGYLWCMRTCVDKPAQVYSRSVNSYADQIVKYILAHPKTAYDEAIAEILARFRDRPKPGT